MNFLKKVLPWIGAAATGGIPALSTMALTTIGNVLGSKFGTVDEAEKALANATPEQIIALKAEDHNFELKMQEMNFKSIADLEEIAAKDRDSARQREVATHDRLPAILAIAITIGFFTMLYIVMIKGVEVRSEQVANIMLGMLGTAWTSVVTYYFGSSAGSAKKDATILATAKSR